MKPKTPMKTVALNLALAGMVSQIGCVTVVIVIGALLVGLWLDNVLDTKPLMTIILVVLSVPVSMYSLVRIALSTAAQFRVTEDKRRTTASRDEQNGEEARINNE